MPRSTLTPFRGETLARCLLTAAACTLALSVMPARAQAPALTLQTLLDRAQIEDMLVTYYGQLGAGRNDFGSFYVEDGDLNVNGVVGKGQKQIEELYRKVAAGTTPHPGIFRMLLTNVKIVVNGESATADAIWTGVNSEKLTATPQFIEQGMEHDELVKRNGRWYFKHRSIMSDGGMQTMFLETRRKK
jgi:hypothetical protein